MKAQLKAQLDQARQAKQQLQITYAALRELNDQVNNVVSAQQEAHAYRDRLQSLADRQQELEGMKARISGLEQQIPLLEQQIADLEQQIAQL